MAVPVALERLAPVCPACGFEPAYPAKHAWPPATQPGLYAHLCDVFGLPVEQVKPDIEELTRVYEMVCLSCGAPFRAVFYRAQA